MKMAVVGTGMIAREALTALRQADGIEVTVLCARPHSRDKACALAREFGVPQAIGSFAAAAVVGIAALKVIHIVHTPNTLLIIPPVIPLVPCVLLYRLLFAVLHIQTISVEELLEALRFGVDGVTIILAIVVGVSIPNIFIQQRIEAQQQREINDIIACRKAEG